MEDKAHNSTTSSRSRDDSPRRTWFDWVNLLATISVPVALGIFTILQSKAQLDQHKVDLQIAEDSQNKDLFIAEHNRANDLFLADDQQKETILSDYENFIIQFIFAQEIPSNKSSLGRLAFRVKTLAALGQLNPPRRTLLIRGLYEAGLIQCNTSVHRSCQPLINLASADMTGLSLGLLPDDDVEVGVDHTLAYTYLIFQQTILRNASFRGVDLSGSVFTRAKLDLADFSFSSVRRGESITFERAKLAGATFDNAHWSSSVFNRSNLTSATFRRFASAASSFDQALLLGTVFEWAMLPNSSFTGAVLRRVRLVDTQLAKSNLSSMESIEECHFLRSNLSMASLVETSIRNSTFTDGQLVRADLRRTRIEQTRFTGTDMQEIDFMKAILDRCTFQGVNMAHCHLLGAALHGTTFFNTNLSNCTGLTIEQIHQTRWMNSTVLPNGTLYTGIHS